MQILHVAMRKARDEDHAIRRIFRDVNLTLKRCPPRKSVIFAFDGSAPLAKLLVQRSRRENSKRNSKYRMSALHLSPGTKFMEDVASAMEYYAFQECTRPCYQGVKFYISGANVPGEGELKCIDWLKNMPEPDESAVIVGGDADLILQGLALSEVKNTFICSQTDAGSYRLSSIWEVVRSLEAMFPGQSALVRIDLAVLIMLNGNDYLPKVRGVSFSRCFQAYQALKRGKHRGFPLALPSDNFLVDGDRKSICWEFLHDLLADMIPSIVAEPEGYVAVSLEQMDLNNRYPPAGSVFKMAVQQGRLGDGVEIEVHDLSDDDSESSGRKKKWKSITWVRGKEYTYQFLHVGKRKTVMHLAAEKLLEELLPDLYDDFLEQEKARVLEQAQLDEENGSIDSNLDEDSGAEDGRERSSRKGKTPLFDVEAFLLGVLWNLQMYIDGYVPNFYWRYSPRYSPSCADIVSWVKLASEDKLANFAVPVVGAPPLPASVACLCMLPMTERGKSFLPKRLQPLVMPGSPLLEALEWRGVSSGLDIPKILKTCQNVMPQELSEFHDDSHSSGAWKVVYLDLAARQRTPPAPPPPSKDFPPLDGRRSNAYKFQRIQVTSMSATSAPRNLPWSNASDSSGEEMPGVLDLPYKKALHGSGKPDGGRRRRGPGGKGGRGSRGGAAPPKSAAWRKKSSAPRIRKSGKAGEGSDPRRGTNVRGEDAAPGLPRRPPPAVAVDVEARPNPFPSSARPDSRGSSMCLGNLAMKRSHCRLLL
ncbi:unnamed protein product [Ectocarpus fasciculatus]